MQLIQAFHTASSQLLHIAFTKIVSQLDAYDRKTALFPKQPNIAPFYPLPFISKMRYKWKCPGEFEILNETVAAEITALTADMQARFVRIAERIGPAGLESLSEPHVKHLEGKLWELRLTGRDGIARALYVTAIGRRVVGVRAFVKKMQKTPRAEIELALRRAKEIT